MKKILVATRPEYVRQTTAAFDGYYEYTVRLNYESAIGALNGSLDMIACNIHFGDAQLYDFLRYAKRNPETKDIPFVCMLGGEDGLSPTLHQSIEIATQSLGAVGFINFSDLRNNLGMEAALKKLRDTMDSILLLAAKK